MCGGGGAGGPLCMGPFSSSSKHSFSSASLVLVTGIRLPETRLKDVVSMHECYSTYFLLMFNRPANASLFVP